MINWLRRLSGLADIPETPNLDALLGELGEEGADLREYIPSILGWAFLIGGGFFVGAWLSWFNDEPLIFLLACLGVGFGALGVRALCAHWLGTERSVRPVLRKVGRRLKAKLIGWHLLWYEPLSPSALAVLEAASAIYLRVRVPFSPLRQKRILEKVDPTAAKALEAMEWGLVELFNLAIRSGNDGQESVFHQPWVEELLKEMRAIAGELEKRAKSVPAHPSVDSFPALYRLQSLRKELQEHREAIEELEQH
ncbi:MAG: hypothetical protein QXI19_05375 [Candidatus Caldarchaeum sp.]